MENNMPLHKKVDCGKCPVCGSKLKIEATRVPGVNVRMGSRFFGTWRDQIYCEQCQIIFRDKPRTNK